MALAKSTHTEQYKRFRAMLVAERKSHGLTQVQVAERLGKPQSFVTKYELGERRIDVVEFLYIADVIGFDPGILLSLLREEPSPAENGN
jgi:transcriptional regulator with XRE-family HTH domain